MHDFHPYNSELPQIITSFKGNQKLILGGFRYNIHHVKEGVKTWRCVCAKKLTGSRSWCKGRAETWDGDSKGIPKGEHNHSTEHELAELEYFKSQMILAAISEPTTDLSTLIDEAAKFLSEGLNFGNRESMKKSLLVARKSLETGEFVLGKQRTVGGGGGGQPRSSSSSLGRKKGGGSGRGTAATSTAQQSGKMTAMASAAAAKGTNKSVPVTSLLSVSALPMPSSSLSSKFPSPSTYKRSAAASSDGTAASFDTSAASCSNTSGYGTLSSSGIADEDTTAHGIGWMDLSGESGNFMMSTEQLNQTTGPMNGGANVNLLGVEGHSSSTDQQQLLAAALFAAAMLGNTSTTSATLPTTLSSSNTSNIGLLQQHQQQHTVGDVMMSMMMPSNNNNSLNNKGTKRASARCAAMTSTTASSGGVGAVQAKQQHAQTSTPTTTGTLEKNRNSVINARKKTARVNCILNKLSTKAAEKSVSPSPSSNNSESCSAAVKPLDSVDGDEQQQKDHNSVPVVQRDKQLVTVSTQTDRDTVEDEEMKGTRKRKSDENAPFGREQQHNGKEGTEKRKVMCCCCCEESELSEWEMPLGCKRRVLKTEQNGTTTKQQQKPKLGREEEAMREQDSDLEQDNMFETDHEIKLEIAEEDEQGERHGQVAT